METKDIEVTSAYISAAKVRETIIDVSIKTLYRWAATDPTMPVFRNEGTVRFHRERLIRWLRAREQGRAS